MSNRARINELRLNQGLPVAGVADLGTGTSAYFAFEVRTGAGVFVSPLQFVYGWQARREVNKPEWCQFSYPGDAVGADALVYPNEVWQYRNGVLLRRFTISTETRIAATAETLTIEGDGLLAQLGQEVVVYLAEEDETGEPIERTIGQILTAMFAEQAQTPRIRIGQVAAAIRNTTLVYGVEDKPILECLNELQRIAGGFFWVDTQRRLQWRRQTGRDAGNRITLDRNATQIQRRRVYREIVTRMIGIGRGVAQGNETRVVVNDTAAQSTYGIRIGYYTHRGIVNEDALEAATTAALARVSGPRDTYDVGVIDLSASEVLDFSFDAGLLELGTRVNIVAGEFNLWPRVVAIHEDGDDPLDLQLKFSDPEAGGITSPEAGGEVPAEGGNDPTRAVEQDLVDKILDIKQRVERQEGNTGILAAVSEAIGTAPVPGVGAVTALADVAHWSEVADQGNLPDLLRALIELLNPSIPDPPEPPVNVQDFGDALDAYLEDRLGEDLPLNIPAVPSPAENAPQNIVSTASAVGTSGLWAKEDHVHNGMPWVNHSTKGGLEGIISEGEIGHTTGTTKRGYMKINGATVCITHLEA